MTPGFSHCIIFMSSYRYSYKARVRQETKNAITWKRYSLFSVSSSGTPALRKSISPLVSLSFSFTSCLKDGTAFYMEAKVKRN